MLAQIIALLAAGAGGPHKVPVLSKDPDTYGPPTWVGYLKWVGDTQASTEIWRDNVYFASVGAGVVSWNDTNGSPPPHRTWKVRQKRNGLYGSFSNTVTTF